MVTIEQLEALDVLVWLGSGVLAARVCLCDESTITRRVRSVLKAFDLSFNGPRRFDLAGDQMLLRIERRLHQIHRYSARSTRAGGVLRLDASLMPSVLCLPDKCDRWFGACSSLPMASGRLLDLLHGRIIDAVIVPDLVCIDGVLDGLIVVPLGSRGEHLLVLPQWADHPYFLSLTKQLNAFFSAPPSPDSLVLPSRLPVDLCG